MSLKKTAKLALATLATGALLSTTGAAAASAVDTDAAATHSDTTVVATTSGAAADEATPRGYKLVFLPNKNVPNFQRRTVWCPPGKHAIGGGAEAQGPDAVLVGSFPRKDGKGWIGLGRQIGQSSVGISVYAICA